MNEKYYHYTTGRYGLVDTFYRNIWLNVNNEKLAHSIKETFVSKLRLSVFDLTIFSNYTDQTVDSECCLHWHVPLSADSIFSRVLPFECPTVKDTQTVYPGSQLTEELPVGLYTNQQKLDLQNQLFFYKKIIETLPGDSILLPAINYIFQTEIDISIIEDQLHQLSINNLDIAPLDSVDVLNIIKKLYD